MTSYDLPSFILQHSIFIRSFIKRTQKLSDRQLLITNKLISSPTTLYKTSNIVLVAYDAVIIHYTRKRTFHWDTYLYHPRVGKYYRWYLNCLEARTTGGPYTWG